MTFAPVLTHWGRVTHICVGNLTIIGSDNGLSPGRRQAITWANVGILLIGPLGTTLSEMLIEIHTFSLKKIHLKTSSGKRRPFCLGLNVLIPTRASTAWHTGAACWSSRSSRSGSGSLAGMHILCSITHKGVVSCPLLSYPNLLHLGKSRLLKWRET